MWKRVQVLINPASGSPQPVLSQINEYLRKHNLNYHLTITHDVGDARNQARIALARGTDVVAVYGGDGTIMEVAVELHSTNIPLVILPGGTANVIAKELDIPFLLDEALAVFSREPRLHKIDMGLCNSEPFVIRLNFGLFADMVTRTARERKTQLGNLAYTISAFESMAQARESTYTLQIGDTTHTLSGIGLMVANAGNIGIPGVSLLPDMKIDDGALDIFVLKSADISLLAALTSRALNPEGERSDLDHWQVQSAHITVEPKQTAVLDDRTIEIETIALDIIPQSLVVAL